jgi:hypothetical protein
MKKRCAGLVVVLVSLSVFGVANAEILFHGILKPLTYLVEMDSVVLTSPDMTFLTPGWGSHTPLDTHHFTGVTAWPASVTLHGNFNGFPHDIPISNPLPSTWYELPVGVVRPSVYFWEGAGVEESKPAVERLQCLSVSPSVVTGQMAVRLQPVGTGRPVVEIHDVAGNVVRSLRCTAGASGAATATWNREDDRGRPVPEGVYFCRYAAADVIAVRKVLVAQ